jgi:hypothetical protein
MKKLGGKEVQVHAFLTFTPDRGEWSTSRPGRFTYDNFLTYFTTNVYVYVTGENL